MRRVATWLLIACFGVLGTGALRHLHGLSHLADRGAATSGSCSAHVEHSQPAPAGDPTRNAPSHHSCDLCLQLHQPAVCLNWVGVLIGIGAVVDRIAPVTLLFIETTAVERIDCRGPPDATAPGTCASIH
jgi:hypothetical protein